MKYISVIILCLAIIACGNNDTSSNDGVVGEWELIEQLIDPGDGSGVYMPVNSCKTVEFKSDSTVVSNAPLCSLGIECTQSSEGTYSEATGEITSTDCGFVPFPLSYELDGDDLIISHPCDEPCLEKFRRIE